VKTNPYTGLPDDLHDTFACIRVFEHPIEIRSFEPGRWNSELKQIDIPDGWELIYVGAVEKFINIKDSRSYGVSPQTERVTVPTYIVGRRRDQYIEDLSAQLEDAQIALGRTQRELITAHQQVIELRTHVEQETKLREQAMDDATNAQRQRQEAETRAELLEQQLAELRSKL
jgi:hypothetical protein